LLSCKEQEEEEKASVTSDLIKSQGKRVIRRNVLYAARWCPTDKLALWPFRSISTKNWVGVITLHKHSATPYHCPFASYISEKETMSCT